MANINKIRLSGTTYDVQDPNATRVVSLTQAEYDVLPASAKSGNTLFVITDAQAADLSNYYTKTQIDTMLGNLKLVKLTSAEYEALTTKDNSTVYFIGDSNGYVIKIGETSVS